MKPNSVGQRNGLELPSLIPKTLIDFMKKEASTETPHVRQKTLPEILDEMESRAEAASYEPWLRVDNRNNHWGMREISGPKVFVQGFTIATDVGPMAAMQVEADIDFIAAARTDLPALIKAVRRAIHGLDNIHVCGKDRTDALWANETLSEVAAILSNETNQDLGEKEAHTQTTNQRQNYRKHKITT